MALASACGVCGGAAKVAYWSSHDRRQVIERCASCWANFHGPGYWVPRPNPPPGADDVDPHETCAHGHGPHSDPRQMGLF